MKEEETGRGRWEEEAKKKEEEEKEGEADLGENLLRRSRRGRWERRGREGVRR